MLLLMQLIIVLLDGEAVITPTFQLGNTCSTPGGDIYKTPENVC